MATITERFEATQKLRIHQYWVELHNRKRIIAAINALNAGQTQARVATILGVHHSTLVRNGIVKGADPDNVTWNIVIGEPVGDTTRQRRNSRKVEASQ